MKRFLIILLFLIPFGLFGQENHFSQFYNSPHYLNPAFAGDAAFIRTGTHSRIISPVAGFPVINTLLHYDMKLINYHSGIAVNLFNHTEELRHFKIQFNYSYTFRINNNAWVKGGLGVSFNQRRSSSTTRKFPDQYDITGYTGAPTAEPLLNDNSNFSGVAAGIILYNKYLWVSFAGDYLNRPTEYFAGTKSIYPIKIGGAVGFAYPLGHQSTARRRFSDYGGLKPYNSIGPVFNYQYQGMLGELSGGLSFNSQPAFGGIHYRYQHDFRITDTKYIFKAISIMLGYREEEFMIAYSYDISLSKTTINRNGAHELSFSLYFSYFKNDHKKHALVPTPSQLVY